MSQTKRRVGDSRATRRKKTGSRVRKRLEPGERAHLSVKMASDLLLALDKEAKRRSDVHGFVVRRSDVVTVALSEWLQERARVNRRGREKGGT